MSNLAIDQVATESGDDKIAVIEKAFAHYRYGENSYQSIEGGWGVEMNRASGSEAAGEWNIESYFDATELANDIAARCRGGASVSVGVL